MIGKMKILAIVFSLVIGGSAATLAMNGEQESDAGCKDAPKSMCFVHLAEVEALYDHEIYLLINSDNGEPICGIVEILPPKLPEREYREEWEERECREDEDQEERESEEEERTEEDYEEDEEEERGGEREEECEEEREDGCCREEDERSDDEERERREHCREREERQKGGKHSFRFNFEEGRGRLLLFPSSHRCLGATAIIKVRTQGELRITPIIYVKNTDVVVYPDSEDEEGHYCEVERIRGGARYGFEDLMDSPDIECDWDYDDVVLCIKKLPKKERHYQGGRVYTLSVRWGQLDGNEGHEEMIPWDGSIFVGDGAVVLIEPLLFDYEGDYNDGGDDLIFEQVSKNEIQWRASTTVHWDGILVLIIVPEGHRETHVAIHTEQWSGVFDEDDLPGLHERFEINDLEDELEINGWKGKERPPCIGEDEEEEKEE